MNQSNFCESSADCGNNGLCENNDRCRCEDGWVGERCGLAASHCSPGYYRSPDGSSCWECEDSGPNKGKMNNDPCKDLGGLKQGSRLCDGKGTSPPICNYKCPPNHTWFPKSKGGWGCISPGEGKNHNGCITNCPGNYSLINPCDGNGTTDKSHCLANKRWHDDGTSWDNNTDGTNPRADSWEYSTYDQSSIGKCKSDFYNDGGWYSTGTPWYGGKQYQRVCNLKPEYLNSGNYVRPSNNGLESKNK